jgi:hypothetical protein
MAVAVHQQLLSKLCKTTEIILLQDKSSIAYFPSLKGLESITTIKFHTITIMKKIFIYTLLCLFIYSLEACKSSVATNNTNNLTMIVGKWRETWDNNSNNTDIYSLRNVEEKLQIGCATHKYKFENISFVNNILRFTLLNTDKYVGETYTIVYELRFDKEKDIFEGKANTNKGVEAKIIWKKF